MWEQRSSLVAHLLLDLGDHGSNPGGEINRGIVRQRDNKIIHSINLVNTFYDFFHHICMSPDSPVFHMKQVERSKTKAQT